MKQLISRGSSKDTLAGLGEAGTMNPLLESGGSGGRMLEVKEELSDDEEEKEDEEVVQVDENSLVI